MIELVIKFGIDALVLVLIEVLARRVANNHHLSHQKSS